VNPMPAKPKPELDERVTLPLDPEVALRALLAVDPDAEPAGLDDVPVVPDEDTKAGQHPHGQQKRR